MHVMSVRKYRRTIHWVVLAAGLLAVLAGCAAVAPAQQPPSEVDRRLRELEEQDEMLFLHESGDAMLQEIDNQEAKNVRRKAR